MESIIQFRLWTSAQQAKTLERKKDKGNVALFTFSKGAIVSVEASVFKLKPFCMCIIPDRTDFCITAEPSTQMILMYFGALDAWMECHPLGLNSCKTSKGKGGSIEMRPAMLAWAMKLLSFSICMNETPLREIFFSDYFRILKQEYGAMDAKPILKPVFGQFSDFEARTLHAITQVETAGELVGKSGLSGKTFNQYFERRFRSTPARWLRDRRLERMRRLSAMPDVPLGTVLQGLDQASASHTSDLYYNRFEERPEDTRRHSIEKLLSVERFHIESDSIGNILTLTDK